MYFRSSKEDVREFDKICRKEGISRETAIELFVQTVIKQKHIPSGISPDEIVVEE